MDQSVKFVRVRGKVIPIRADQLGRQPKKRRDAATDTVTAAEASKYLKDKAKTARKVSDRSMQLSNATTIGSIAALGVELASRGKIRRAATRAGWGLFGASVLSGIASGVAYAHGKALSKDARGLAKGKAPQTKAGNFISRFIPGFHQPTPQPQQAQQGAAAVVLPPSPGATSL